MKTSSLKPRFDVRDIMVANKRIYRTQGLLVVTVIVAATMAIGVSALPIFVA